MNYKKINEAIQKRWPTCKLEYISQLGYWVVTDYLWASGCPAKNHYRKAPVELLPISRNGKTNRKIVFMLSHPETEEPLIPSLRPLISMMERAYQGADIAEIGRRMDAWEDGEDEFAERTKRSVDPGMKDAANVAWDRAHGKITVTAAGITNQAKVSDSITKEMAESTREDFEGYGPNS